MRYWAARSIDGDFAPNAEVDELVWLPVPTRWTHWGTRMTEKCCAASPNIRRHADGADRAARHRGQQVALRGDDRKRPLDKHGRAQAEVAGRSTPRLRCRRAVCRRLRCHQTVEPLAEELGVSIHNEPALTEEAYSDDRKRARQRVLEIAAAGGTPVICTQGKVIPDLIAWWCDPDGVRPDKSRNRKGSTWVLSLSEGRLVAADHIGSPLAAKKCAPGARADLSSRRYAADRVDPRRGLPRTYLRPFLAGALRAGALLADFLAAAFLTTAFRATALAAFFTAAFLTASWRQPF